MKANLKQHFNDVRVAITISIVWVVLSLGFFFAIGLLESRFFRFGPSSSCSFVGMTIDSWTKWGLLMFYTFIWEAGLLISRSFSHLAFIMALYSLIVRDVDHLSMDPSARAKHHNALCALPQSRVSAHCQPILGLRVALWPPEVSWPSSSHILRLPSILSSSCISNSTYCLSSCL